MSTLLLQLILICISQAQAAPLNATVCAHILSAAARLPIQRVAPGEIPKVLEILSRLSHDPEFGSSRLDGIRQAVLDPNSEVFYFDFLDIETGDEFISDLLHRLELADKHRRSTQTFWRGFIFRNPLLHFDQFYRIARHSDPSARAELQFMIYPARSEHFERDYELHEIVNRAGLPRPTSRQGRIDTAAWFERFLRRLVGDPYPHLVDRKVSLDIFLEDPPHLSIFVRMKKIKPI